MVAALGARVAKADEELEGLQEGDREGWAGPNGFIIACRGDYFSPVPAMPLTLVVPDLLPHAASRGLRLPALEGWLARADRAREPGPGPAWLLRQWGLAPDAPVAALTLAADGGPREGEWLRADPVHQRVEGHGLVVHDASALELAPGEIRAALAALNDFFAQDGLAFVAPGAGRWYVRVPPGEMPRTVPLEEVVGRNPFGRLPEGGTRLRWPALFSEAQMLLAALPFNAEREAAGRPALNALWFWGGGSYPAGLPRAFDCVAADEALARSLALASGCAVQAMPGAPDRLPLGPAASCLVVLDTLQAPARRGDAPAWEAAAGALEAQWFSRLGEILRLCGRVRLVLPSEDDTAVFELRRRTGLRFWRRAAPLASHA